MPIFDTITKAQAQTHPMDFVHYLLGSAPGADVSFVEHITPEQATVEMHQADSVMKIQHNGQAALVHLEFQTTDSSETEMGLRMAGYIIRLMETYGLPVHSSVIYLRPDAGRRDTGVYVKEFKGTQVSVKYQVLRLIEINGQQVLDARSVGLLPFTPLMKPPEGMDSEMWLRECVRVADSVEVPDKSVYLGALAVLSNLVYDSDRISNIIVEETMHKPDILEYWAKEAHQLGAKTQAMENILEVLEVQLSPEVAHQVKPQLQKINDLQHLRQLHRAALTAENPDDFYQALKANGENN